MWYARPKTVTHLSTKDSEAAWDKTGHHWVANLNALTAICCVRVSHSKIPEIQTVCKTKPVKFRVSIEHKRSKKS